MLVVKCQDYINEGVKEEGVCWKRYVMKKLFGVNALILIPLCLFAGCAKYWYQEGKTITEVKQDQKVCFEELEKYSSNWRDMGDYEFIVSDNFCGKTGGFVYS
jgi:hypothetical protein